jgi:hypothetical protein
MRRVVGVPTRAGVYSIDTRPVRPASTILVLEGPGSRARGRFVPVLEATARELGERLRRVRTEDAGEAGLDRRRGISSVPTLLPRLRGREGAQGSLPTAAASSDRRFPLAA